MFVNVEYISFQIDFTAQRFCLKYRGYNINVLVFHTEHMIKFNHFNYILNFHFLDNPSSIIHFQHILRPQELRLIRQ